MSSVGDDPEPGPNDEFNPYAPPRTPIEPQPRSSRPTSASRAAHRETISVPHDLTDVDLRHFVNCDVLYDPLPLWGVIPQWVWYLAILAPVMFFFSFPLFHSVGLSAVNAAVVSCLTMFYMSLLARYRRTIARRFGLCENRSLGIDPDGLTIALPTPVRVSADLQTVGPLNCAWSDIRKIEAREGYIFFWLKGRVRVVLPMSAFPTDTEAHTFLEAAKRWHEAAH